MVETPGDHGTHKYCKLLLVLRLIPLKILRFKFLQGFVMCFFPIFSEVDSWCLSFVFQTWWDIKVPVSLTIRSRKRQSRFSKPPHVCYGFGENLSRHLVHILLLPCNFKTIQYHQCYHCPLHDLFSVAHREKLTTKDLTCQIHLKSQKGLWKDKSWHSALHLVVASINLLATVCLIQVDRIKITMPKFLLWFSTKIIW